MSTKSKLFLRALGGVDPLSLLREALGEHYDVKEEEEQVVVGDRVLHEPVIRIYDKGGTIPRLSLWLF